MVLNTQWNRCLITLINVYLMMQRKLLTYCILKDYSCGNIRKDKKFQTRTHFMPLVLSIYPLKTWKNLWISDAFKGVLKESSVMKWVKLARILRYRWVLISDSMWKLLNFKPTQHLRCSWQTSLWNRNQSIDLKSKSMDWFLYDRNLRNERVKEFSRVVLRFL